MRKAVLISIQPKWCELIASGKKTIEVRKNRPKIDTPFKCYIYCSKSGVSIYGDGKSYITDNANLLKKSAKEGFEAASGFSKWNGKVIGEFICDEIERVGIPYPAYQNELDKRYIEQSCVSYYELHRYFGRDDGYFWHISDLKIYDKPKELSEFSPADCGKRRCFNCECFDAEKPSCTLKRPPQSWCYVEEREDEESEHITGNGLRVAL